MNCIMPVPPQHDAQSGGVLFVADLFHPVHDLAVELFLNGDMSHGGGQCSTMPMLFTRREPDHIDGTDLLNRFSLALDPVATGGDNQCLPQRMRVPRGSSAGFKCDRGSGYPSRLVWLEQGFDARRAREPVTRIFPSHTSLS
jgi:hypothetical protein